MLGMLIVVTGPSGVGKGTILQRFIPQRKDTVFAVSATTRPAREGEIEGKDYYFVSDEEFDSLLQSESFIEWNQVFGYRYGTLKKSVFSHLEQGTHVILDVEIEGAAVVLESYPEAVSVFILPPSLDALRERLEKRGTESAQQQSLRLERAERELAYRDSYRYWLVNEDVAVATQRLHAIIEAEMSSRSWMSKLLDFTHPAWRRS